MELLLLWRWSTLVQAISNVIIAVFFIALALSLRRRELHAWLGAWLFDLGALLVTIAFWLLRPESRLMVLTAGAGYLFAKTMFVGLLVIGASGFRGRPASALRYRILTVTAAAFAIITACSIHSTDQLGVAQETVIALVFGIGAVHLLRLGGYGWVAAGMVMRAALSLVSVVTYAIQWRYGSPIPGSNLSYFVAAHSSFDTGAEWVIALGCLLTTYRLIQHELTDANAELRQARDQMQRMLHRDQLTGVANRRALPGMLADAREAGATVLFFDLDGFKKINDEQGHHIGDASLTRFAQVLEQAFRQDDRVIRYAGDEFIVLARDLDPFAVEARVQRVRQRLQEPDPSTPQIDFSVGMAVLSPRADPEQVMREADQAMYRAKSTRTPATARESGYRAHTDSAATTAPQ